MRRIVQTGWIIGALLIFGQQPVSGQRQENGQAPTFRQVDTTTYRLYLEEDWKRLIREGKSALEHGIDYYFLQMRIAYAYYALGKYRQAARFYKNALGFNNQDPTANAYLYHAYKFGGRELDALRQSGSLSASQKSAMGINDSNHFTAFGLNYAWAGANTAVIQDNIVSNTDRLNPGTQKATHAMHYVSATLSHRLGTFLVLTHQGSYLFKNELSYVVANARTYLSEEQPVHQYEYSLDGDFRLAEGLVVRPGVHYLNTTVPLYAETSYGPGSGVNRTPVSELKIADWVKKFMVSYLTRYTDLGVSYVHHNFNDITTHQAGFHSILYPLTNLNLYLGVDAYVHFSISNNVQSENYLIRPLLGGKIFNNLWLEVSGSPMEQFNFYDIRNNLAFNNLEKIARSVEANVIIPFYQAGMQLFFGYRYRSVNSMFFPAQDLLQPINQQNYQSHIITGGIKWKH
jgi:tetratricopeptide (TPR) repeat protein